MKNGFKAIDSDLHIMEPVDLWQRYIDPQFKHLAPIGTAKSVGDLNIYHPDGRMWGRDPVRSVDTGRPPGQRSGFNDQRFADHFRRGYSNQCQLEAMDAEGLDVGVIYPSRGLHAMGEPAADPKLLAAVARAYNDWLYDFCGADRQRLLGAAMLSAWDINDAVAETRRCVEKYDFRAVFLRPNIVAGRNWYDPYYAPLWSTLEALEIPLGFHEAIFTALPEVGSIFGTNFMLRHVFCHPVEQMQAVAAFAGGGIFARHPKLRVAFLEGNCSWVPFLLWRLDEHYEQNGDVWVPENKMEPSGYFKRQGYASVEPDEEPVKLVVEWMGSDNLVFSTDYPHGDSKYPGSVARFLQLSISDADKRKILWDNCADIYGVARPVRA